MTEKIFVLGVGVLECTFMTGSPPSHMWFLGLSDEELIESALETVVDAIGSDENLVNDFFIFVDTGVVDSFRRRHDSFLKYS